MRKRSFSILNKAILRKHVREQCRSIAPVLRSRAAEQAAREFVSHPIFEQSHTIASYLARDDEFDSMPLMQKIWQAKKRCYLPILSIAHDKQLEFGAYRPGDGLRPNRYRILEPEVIIDPIAPAELDVVILPLIAFDKQGHRLGSGAGYYDRTFAFLREKKLAKPWLLGLAYQSQEITHVPVDSWDIPLHGVITERGIILC